MKENDSNAAIITEPLGQDVKQPAEDTVKIGDTNIRKGAREGLLLPETENNCAIHTEEHEVHEESNKNEKGVLTEVEGVKGGYRERSKYSKFGKIGLRCE